MPKSDDHISVAAVRCEDAPAGGLAEAWLFLAAALGVTAATIAILDLPFLLSKKLFYHDSLAHATLMGLFYERLFSGDSWLWSAALNAGHPLWVSLEVAPIMDPVALVSYSFAAAFRTGWLTPYYVSAFAWLFALAIGSALCAHWLTGNRWAALLTFLLLFAGPVALAVPAQSSGLLNPFRFCPFVLYLYLRLRERVTFNRALVFATILAFSLAGYQSVYAFIIYLTLVLAEFLAGGRAYLAWLAELCKPRYLCLAFIPLFALAPTIAWLEYTRWLVAIPREFLSTTIFFFEVERVLRNLFLPYLEAASLETAQEVWHGFTFIGFFATPFLLVGLRLGLVDSLRRARGGGTKPLERHLFCVLLLCLAFTLSLAAGLFGLRELVEAKGTLFEIRNFGLLFTGIYLLLGLIVARGFADVMERRHDLSGIAIDTLAFAGFILLSYRLRLSLNITARELVGLLGVFVMLSLLWWYLATRFGRLWLALAVVMGVLAELLMYGSPKMTSLEAAPLPVARGEYIRTLVETRLQRFGSEGEALPDTRAFLFDPAPYWPFHLEGPAVVNAPSAVSEPIYNTPIDKMGQRFTHLFRLPAYHELITGSTGTADLKEILGVTRRILELVPDEALDETADGLQLVLRSARQTNETTTSADSGEPAGRILEVDYAGDRVAIDVEALSDSVLIYRDNFAPGWTAQVDGEAAELLVVDRVNKAVAVPPGKHRVEYLYRPWTYLVTFALRTIVLILAACGCLVVFVRAERRPVP